MAAIATTAARLNARQWSTLSGEMDAPITDETTDESLMLRYVAGDAGAFDVLYARHRAGLFRFIHRQCRVRERAEEIFQEVWMNLIQSAPRYRVEAQFRTFLFTLAHHKIVDTFRAHGRRDAVLVEVNNDEPVDGIANRADEPHVRAESSEQASAILRLLDQLPAPQREAFLLHEEGGLNVEEIAEATGVTHEAAKSRLRYAVAKLREGLADYR